MPDNIVTKLKQESTLTAKAIEIELKALQKKFPAYKFLVTVDAQYLGSNVFYQVNIKTYVNDRKNSNGKAN